MMNSFVNFKDQVCVVTGAGSPTGIGFCTAKILGQLGGKIAIVATTDRIYQRASELEEMGITAKGYIADLMDREQVKAVVKASVKAVVKAAEPIPQRQGRQRGKRQCP
jgi:3-oxoacyl-[acyl-carrier protein] reductase